MSEAVAYEAPITQDATAIAVFDLDGTITHRDTYLPFLLAVLRVRPGRLTYCPALAVPVIGALLGRTSHETLKRRFLAAIVGGMSLQALAPVVEAFVRHTLATNIKDEAIQRIAWHREQGHDLILATASLDLYGEAIGRALGFDEIVCTATRVEGGRVSGELAGPNLHGTAKLNAVLALDAFQGRRRCVFAYSDHARDLPLLRFADYAVVVDPTRRFARTAQACGLEIGRWTRPEK